MQNPLLWTIIGILLSFSVFLANVIFKMGRMDARVESLEAWRLTIRQDMHEISAILTNMTKELGRLATLIEERTDRRIVPRIEDKEN